MPRKAPDRTGSGLFFLLSAVFTCLVLACSQRPASVSVFPGIHWESLTPAEAGLETLALDSLSAFLGGRGCVVRHGRMVYTWGEQDRRADIASSAKIIYSFFLIRALEAGLIPSLDQTVDHWEPRLDSLNPDLGCKDREITWRHLSNQVSCYGVRERPGQAFDYSDPQMGLFWDLLFRKVYGATLENVDSLVLLPVLRDIMQCQDSPTFLAFGSEDRPGRVGISVRDFARVGLLFLHGGQWNGKALISPEHARMLVSSPLPLSIPRTAGDSAEMLPGQRSIGGGNNQCDHEGSYSFLWWINGVTRTGERLWPDAPSDCYGGFGHGGKRALVVLPGHNMVLSWNDSPLDTWPGVNEALKRLVAALRE